MSSHLLLWNPKFPHNVGGALRAASCFGSESLWFTGSRVSAEPDGKRYRLPREERMKGYSDVQLLQGERPFDHYEGITPVAIELSETAEQLVDFEHPEDALYVFGPEDGGIPAVARRHCHRFVVIPTKHCTNLAAAIYIVLYDRLAKRVRAGLEPRLSSADLLDEERGWWDHEEVRV